MLLLGFDMQCSVQAVILRKQNEAAAGKSTLSQQVVHIVLLQADTNLPGPESVRPC